MMNDMSISRSLVVFKFTDKDLKELPPAKKFAQSTVAARPVLKMLLISANLTMNSEMKKFNNSAFFVVCKIK